MHYISSCVKLMVVEKLLYFLSGWFSPWFLPYGLTDSSNCFRIDLWPSFSSQMTTFYFLFNKRLPLYFRLGCVKLLCQRISIGFNACSLSGLSCLVFILNWFFLYSFCFFGSNFFNSNFFNSYRSTFNRYAFLNWRFYYTLFNGRGFSRDSFNLSLWSLFFFGNLLLDLVNNPLLFFGRQLIKFIHSFFVLRVYRAARRTFSRTIVLLTHLWLF